MTRMIVFFLFISIFSSAGQSQDLRQPIYNIHIGMGKPLSPENFQSDWMAGYDLGAGISTRIKSNLELRTMISWNNFMLNDNSYMKSHDIFDEYTMLDGGDRNVLTIMLQLKRLFPTKSKSSIIPYFLAGAGWMRINTKGIQVFLQDKETTLPREIDNTFAAETGIGFDMLMDKHTTLFFECRFAAGFTKSKSTVILPILFGFSLH